MEYYAAERKKELLPFATAWTDLENICLSAGSEKQIPYDLTFNWNISNRRKKQTKYNQRHGNKEQTDSNQRGGRREIMWESKGSDK